MVSSASAPENARADSEPSNDLALVLTAVTELLRSHREILEAVQRIEARLEERSTATRRLTAPDPADEGPGLFPEDEVLCGLLEDAEPQEPQPPPSEEDLLRKIELALRSGSSVREG